MTLVRVVWAVTGPNVFKRSGVTGPAPQKDLTLLTKAGVELADGHYSVGWSFFGETGSTVVVTVQKKTDAGWLPLIATGPHAIPNDSAKIDSVDRIPPNYKEMTFRL